MLKRIADEYSRLSAEKRAKKDAEELIEDEPDEIEEPGPSSGHSSIRHSSSWIPQRKEDGDRFNDFISVTEDTGASPTVKRGRGRPPGRRGRGRRGRPAQSPRILTPSTAPLPPARQTEEGGLMTQDGSPMFDTKNLGLTEMAEMLLTKIKPGQVCTWVPQTPASVGNCCFYLDLPLFSEQYLAVGDLACDGYEPWGRTSTGGWHFVRVGEDFQRVIIKEGQEGNYDLVVRERRSRKEYLDSRLLRKMYTVETPERGILKEFGAALVYNWSGPPVEFPALPHGNAKKPGKLAQKFVRTAPATLHRAQQRLQELQSANKQEIMDDTNREICTGADEHLTNSQLLRDRKQIYYLSSKRKNELEGGPAMARQKLKEDDLIFALQETFKGRFVRNVNVSSAGSSSNNTHYHIFCAQERQLEIIRKFGCFKPPETEEEALQMDLYDKRILFADMTSAFTDCYIAVLGMSHPFFEASETQQEAFLPVGYLLMNYRDKMDFSKCADLLATNVDSRDEGLVFFGLAADLESPLYSGFAEKPIFQEPCRHVLNEFHMQEVCQMKLRDVAVDSKSVENILIDIFGSCMDSETWRYEGSIIDSQTEEEVNMKMEALRYDWDHVAPGFFNFFARKLDHLKMGYLIPQREAANLREFNGRTQTNRLLDLETALKLEMDGRRRLSIDETLMALDKYTEAVYHKLELAVLQGSRVVPGDTDPQTVYFSV